MHAAKKDIYIYIYYACCEKSKNKRPKNKSCAPNKAVMSVLFYHHMMGTYPISL